MLAHLNTVSGFSLQYGTAKVADLVNQAKQLGFSHLALVDRDTLAGAISFASACQKVNIKPILGVNFKVNNSRVILLAKNTLGFASLCRLVSTKNLNFENIYKEINQKNLIVSLGAHSNFGQAIRAKQLKLAQEILQKWIQIAQENLVVELVTHQSTKHAYSTAVAAEMLKLAKDNKVKAIVTNAVRYLLPVDAKTADVLDAIRIKQKINFNRVERNNSQGYLKDPFQMAQLAQEIASAANETDLAGLLIKFTEDVAEACALDPVADLGFGSVSLPEAEVILNGSSLGAFRELTSRCEAGLSAKGLLNTDQYRQRLEAELAVVSRAGFASYFLTVAEVVNLTKKLKIRVTARGSGAGSLINFSLGISAVDPIVNGLLMERFFSNLRTTLPDIDIDVESDRRLEVYDVIINRFGANRAICLSMRDTYRVRQAIRDVGAALGYPASEIDLFAKLIPRIKAKDIRKALSELPELRKSSFYKLFTQGKLDTYLDLVEKLDGLPKNLAMHPCGILLSNAQLLDRTPIMQSASGYPMSEFDKDDVEQLGFLKLDVLGVRMQSALAHAVNEIKNNQQIMINLDEIDLADKKTFELIQSTKTLGCFQIESPGQRELVGKFSPQTFNDLIIDISLFRPGPMKSDMIRPFLSAREGQIQPDYLHPEIQPILEETWGVVVFHEQVIKLISLATGCNFAQADEIRRKLGDFNLKLEIQGWFTRKALKKYPLALVEKLWKILESFASFGFCKAHAAAFALPTYQSAWLKAHYPAAFFAGVLTHDPGMYPKRLIVNDAKNFKIKILPLDINISDQTYRAEGEKAIRVSLAEVKGINQEEISRILHYRPYTSLADFWSRARISRPVIERLILSGAFDSIYQLPKKGLNRRDLLIRLSQLEHSASSEPAQLAIEGFLQEKIETYNLPDLTLEEVVRHEVEILGMDLSCHLTYFYRDLLKELKVVFSKDLLNFRNETEVLMAGVKVSIQTPPIRSGKRVVFLTIDDTTGPVDATFFDSVQKDFADVVFNSWLFLVKGKIRRTGPRGVSLIATGCWDLINLHKIFKKEGLLAVKTQLSQGSQLVA